MALWFPCMAELSKMGRQVIQQVVGVDAGSALEVGETGALSKATV